MSDGAPPGVKEPPREPRSRCEPGLRVTRVLEADDLALVVGTWTFEGTGPDGEPVRLSADVLRRQADGTWRFVIDNPWGTA